MSEKQLTVAELLARSGKKTQDSTPRRRRRSIEEGGVSIAELTGNLPKVDATPKQGRHTSESLSEEKTLAEAELVTQEDGVTHASGEDQPAVAEETAFEKSVAPSDDETIVLSVVSEDDPVRLTTDTFPAVDPDEAATTVIPVSAELAEIEETKTVAPAVELIDDTVVSEDENEEKISYRSVLGMAVVGIVLGVAVFLGFQQLWQTLNRPIVAALALAVTGAMIGLVHALRTNRDGLSMVLAGIVGLVMTFGPLFII
ncbi:hypothetical membrane protein [Corynebacterium kutscheri]|uniref:Hypothetical membrane protein n=1 Tax=Corynebacterium kutscheri TaxID=35755 RepID=A0AB38VQ76_9CORY|nr:hypothetical protein [Corynebacterium kutscheri]VEH05129.1 hypothetical membrane protein [Corynebacterium kutscheri]VEH80653.1 hypothetical membrane protein [Corynebacterium kutscheri]